MNGSRASARKICGQIEGEIWINHFWHSCLCACLSVCVSPCPRPVCPILAGWQDGCKLPACLIVPACLFACQSQCSLCTSAWPAKRQASLANCSSTPSKTIAALTSQRNRPLIFHPGCTPAVQAQAARACTQLACGSDSMCLLTAGQ